MNTFFLYKKIARIVLLLAICFPARSQSQKELYEKKWTITHNYLLQEQPDSFLLGIQELKQLAQKNNSNQKAKINYLLGEYWHQNGSFEKAIDYSEKATHNFQKDSTELLLLAETHLVLGYCFLELEEYDQALVQYKKALV